MERGSCGIKDRSRRGGWGQAWVGTAAGIGAKRRGGRGWGKDRDRSEVGQIGEGWGWVREGARKREGRGGVGVQRLGRVRRAGGAHSYFSRVPVTDAVHVQGLLGRVPTQRQWGHLPALLLQLPNGPLRHGQLLLLCLLGTQAAGVQTRPKRRPPASFPSLMRGVAFIREEV